MIGRVCRPLMLLVLVLFVACTRGPSPDTREAGETPSTTEPPALSLAWAWSTPSELSPGLPAADADGVAATWSHQMLVLFDAAGAPRWEAQRLGLLEVAPALTAGLVVAATDDGVVAYDRATGRPRWDIVLREQPTTPVVVGDKVVVTTWEGSMIALHAADGRVAWRAPLGGPSLGPAAVAGSAVLAAFDTGRVAGVMAIDASSGGVRWSVSVPAGGVSTPAVVVEGEVAVVVAGDAAAHGLAVGDGSERWRTPLEGSGSPEVVPLPLGDGRVVVGHRLGGMAMLDGREGTMRWQSAPHGAAVRGGPAGPGPNGWFAMPLDDGRLLLARPDRSDALRDAPGFVRGVAAGPRDVLVLGIGRGDDNHVSGLRGW